MMMGGVELHQELKNLCVNTNCWKYAVFWRLNHQDQMTTLTCEDFYYDNMNDNLRDGCFANDLLGLEVVKMSYCVYSIGEGMVGRVATTGKHLWKSGNQLVSLDEHLDGWRTQLKAGIRTIVAIAVSPYAVVQIGSLKTIPEDLKLVNRIQEIFFDLQCSLIASTNCSPCVTDLTTSSGSGRFHKHVNNTTEKNTWKTVEPIRNHQENEDPVSDFIQSTHSNDQNPNLFMPATSNCQNTNNPNESFMFPIGCELYEALGPAFCKQKNRLDWGDTVTTTETLTNSKVTTNSEHLLEAVVAKGGSMSVHKPAQMHYPEGNPPGSDLLAGGSACEPLAKVGKKRSRPRPKDRQMIQDRIKELRELVPNGSKCSIDSLLERTLKHMLFMQRVTKHADKIPKYAKFKLLGKESGLQLLGSRGHIQGSSWAMEVGNDLKLCPIIVENIGVNGQMLVEMMCDEYIDILEITEAIRSLGLTILKGVTNVHGDKTRMCFVVEGENNRNIHRVDLLWSLIHILQLKTNT
ncbi:hypothetical protein LXL04_018755 [Taraxacum kok-saghyz]